jgi:hypothetical protein
MLGLPSGADIEVLNDDNAEQYWQRSDRFDLALDLTVGRAGSVALGQVISRWLAHLLAVAATVEPLAEMRDVAFNWYVGLDADATQVGDALWRGSVLDPAAQERVVGLYRLVFSDPAAMIEKVRGEPIYLIAAMSTERVVRLKPQNLVAGLPIRHLEAAH